MVVEINREGKFDFLQVFALTHCCYVPTGQKNVETDPILPTPSAVTSLRDSRLGWTSIFYFYRRYTVTSLRDSGRVHRVILLLTMLRC